MHTTITNGLRGAAVLAAAMLFHGALAEETAVAGGCHAGAYVLDDGSQLVISPSEAPNLRYTFLSGVSGRLYPVQENRYESGEGWSVREPVTVRARFGSCEEGSLRLERGTHWSEGHRVALPTTPISFRSGDAVLYGELVLPVRGPARSVVVLQYGSGRDSAVVYNFLQHLLPLEDIAVFVFDKRGTGRSTGEYTADIGTLATDVAAAVKIVRRRSDLQGVPLGVMGESQGGWVVPLAATKVAVDFVVVSYGLAVSMLEEDREEVAQDLRARGFGPDILAKGEEIHAAAARVMVTRFAEGLDELERLKARYREQPWFQGLGGDFTGLLTATPAERMDEIKAVFDFPYDLAYEPLPVLGRLRVPALWVLAGEDTEAPHETTLARLRDLQAGGTPIDIAVFPHADHGMIVVEHGSEGRRLAGRHAQGYFALLRDWIIGRKIRADARYGDAIVYERR